MFPSTVKEHHQSEKKPEIPEFKIFQIYNFVMASDF